MNKIELKGVKMTLVLAESLLRVISYFKSLQMEDSAENCVRVPFPPACAEASVGRHSVQNRRLCTDGKLPPMYNEVTSY